MNKIIIKNIIATTIQIVGNKSKGEGVSFASELTDLGSSESFLKKLIETSFSIDDRKHFTYISSLDLNPVYQFVSKIFDDHDQMVLQSVNLATYLYEQSIHPNIKNGELYVSIVECEVGDECIEALAILKSEQKDSFLTTTNNGKCISVKTLSGTSLRNLDKGCLILNKYREDGYVLFTIDRTNNGNDANYWVENFLHVENCNDDYHKTVSMISVCNSFFNKMQKEQNVDHSEIARAFCKNKEIFSNEGVEINVELLAQNLFTNTKYQKEFAEFLSEYSKDLIPESFRPNLEVTKRKISKTRNTIRLDNNFEVKFLNSDAEIAKGYDEEKDKYYYKLWYDHEK